LAAGEEELLTPISFGVAGGSSLKRRLGDSERLFESGGLPIDFGGGEAVFERLGDHDAT